MADKKTAVEWLVEQYEKNGMRMIDIVTALDMERMQMKDTSDLETKPGFIQKRMKQMEQVSQMQEFVKLAEQTWFYHHDSKDVSKKYFIKGFVEAICLTKTKIQK